MKKNFNIVLAEDHTILRDGLKSLLSSQSDLKIVGEAGDGLEAIRCVRDHSPDMILLDLSMPRMTGLDAIKEIKRVCADTKIIVLTVHSTEEYILATLQAGADGYVLKDAHSTELMTAIRHVLGGRRYLSPSISGTIIDGLLQGKKASSIRSAWETLTQREREILKLIAEGHKNKDIADLLCISLKTVEKHRANLMEKLDLHNVAALTALAAEKGLINQ
ncbi:MAG: response regulator transcription factor [Desulfobacterota bacterium]|nr:response regulator transcription factor [Thermodesulfobacteriota bacterium]